MPAADARSRISLASPSQVPERKGVFSFFSNIERRGLWTLPRLFRTVAIMGNVEIDLTAVDLGAVSDIEVFCMLGNVSIRVPRDVRLEVDGNATIGNFELTQEIESSTDNSAPSIRIKAHVILGSIDVVVVDPNKKGVIERLKARWKLRDTDPD